MSDKTRKTLIRIMRVLTIVMIVAGVILLCAEMKHITIENILNLAPNNKLLAAIFIVVFYTVESFTVIFPVVVLQLCTGVLFKPAIAIAVNIIGLSCSSAMQYLVGRFTGSDYMDKLARKYPRMEKLQEMKNGNEIFGVYMSRIFCLLPMDLVSLFWGTLSLNFKKFMVGSVLGLLPAIICVSLMGDAIRDPGSPQFLISGGAYIVIFVLSIVVYKLIKKKQAQN